MTTIPLTKSTRDTVTTLRNAISEGDQASERLSTGNAVNSALDDPSSYFMAQSLDNRAAELDRSIEQLGQGIQVITAANDGIEAIGKLMTQATAVAKEAASSKDAFDRADYAKSYNKLLDQISGLANDSGYHGKNLLLGAGHELKLYISDSSDEAITVPSTDFTNLKQTLGLSHLDEGQIGAKRIALGTAADGITSATKLVDTSGGFAIGDQIAVTSTDPATGNVTEVASLTVDANTTVGTLTSKLTQADKGLRASLDANGGLVVEAASNRLAIAGGPFDGSTFGASESAWYGSDGTAGTLDDLTKANEGVRAVAASIGSNLTMLQNRASFMKTFSSTLQSSSSALLAADLNEEGARLLALQTRQQLATSSMSITRSADDGVLRLLGG